MFIGNKIAIGMPIMGAAAPAWSNAYSLLLDGVDEYVNIDAVQTALAVQRLVLGLRGLRWLTQHQQVHR